MINVNLLPTTLRRRKRVDPWKAGAVALPLVVLGVCGALQLRASGHEGRLATLNGDLSTEKAVLQPFIDEQKALEGERAELASIREVEAAVRNGRILWSQQLFAMLETRPPPGPQLASRLAFTALEMRTLDEATKTQLLTDNTYEGLDAVAEMSVSGLAGSPGVVADYIREIQSAPNFAVVLSDLSQDAETRFYAFNLTIGAARLGRQRSEDSDAVREMARETVPPGRDVGAALP